jgi:hypothetical protein
VDVGVGTCWRYRGHSKIIHQIIQILSENKLATCHSKLYEGVYTNIYLLLTECEVCSVNYGPSFFHCFMAQACSVQAIRKWKITRIHNYGTDRANEVNKMFIIWQFSN